MRQRTQILLFVVGPIVVAGFIISQIVTAQTETIETETTQATPVYNTYPPGILPADLNGEIAGVLREIDVIEGRAIERWHNLPPPIVINQPPVLKVTGTDAGETLCDLMHYR